MSKYAAKTKGSEQERQLLEVLRDHDNDAASEFRLLVQKQDSAWDVSLSIAPHDGLNTSAELVPPSTTLGTTWRHCGPKHNQTPGIREASVAVMKIPGQRGPGAKSAASSEGRCSIPR
jgi:hypothetical protein